MKKYFSLLLCSCLIFNQFSFIKAKEYPEEDKKLSYHTLPYKAQQKIPQSNIHSAINYDLPSKYDARALNILTSVKNQSNFGDCWAFAAVSASEANLIKKGIADNNINLSEYQLLYHFYHRNEDPLGLSSGDINTAVNAPYYDVGGNNELTAIYLSTWGAFVDDDRAIHPNNTSDVYELDPNLNYDADYKVLDAITIQANDTQAIKQALVKYGALATSYCSDGGSEIYHDYYHYADGRSSNHAVTLVGYDDTISKDLFYPDTPSRDGAWIIKNSWGEYSGDEGYNYISYDSYIDNCIAFDVTSKETYDYNYFYDGSSDYTSIHLGSDTIKVANIFTAQKGNDQQNEYLDAINIGIASDNIDYEIQIYKDLTSNHPESGTKVFDTPQKGSKQFPGLYTIDLKQRVLLEKDCKFSIVITLKDRDQNEYAQVYIADSVNYGWIKTDETTNQNQSFIAGTYTNYSDLHNYGYVARLKAYTNVEKNIMKRAISNAVIQLEKDCYTYNNGIITPDVSITFNDQTLIDGKDYRVEYRNYDQVGTAYVCISGINDYDGYIEIPYTISNQTYQEVVTNKVATYNGNAHTFTISNYPVDSKITYLIEGSNEWSENKPTLTNAGSLKVKYRIEHPNYSDHYGEATITVNKATLNMNIQPLNIEYDGNAYGLAFTLNDEFTIKYRQSESEAWSENSPTITNPGTIKVYFQITHPNYEVYESSTTITIYEQVKQQMNITAIDYKATYDGSSHTFTLKGVPDNATISYRLANENEYSTNKPTFVDCGSYLIYYTIQANGYYDYSGSVTVEIEPREFEEVCEIIDVIYDGTHHVLNIQNIPNDTKIAYRIDNSNEFTYITPDYINVGEHIIEYRLEHPNYITKTATTKITIRKAKANYALNIKNNNHLYDGNEHTFTFDEISDANITYEIVESGIFTDSKPSFIDAGIYHINLHIEHLNYEDYSEQVIIQINKAKANYDINLQNFEGYYDGNAHSFEFDLPQDALISFKTSDDDIATIRKPSFVDAGNYEIECYITHPNYLDEKFNAYVTILPAKMQVTTNDYIGYYDGNKHSFEISCDQSDALIEYRLANDETYTTNPITRSDIGESIVEYRVSKANYETISGSAKITILEKNKYNVAITSNMEQAATFEGDGIYEDGSNVSIHADINPGYNFIGWSIDDDIVSTDLTYQFTISDNMNIRAIFEKASYQITTNYDDSMVVVSGNGTYEYGDMITLQAICLDGYQFEGYYLNDELYASDPTIEICVDQDYAFVIKASKIIIPQYELKLTSNKNVTLTGADFYDAASQVTISTSSNKAMYQFIGWYINDELVSNNPTYTFTINQDLQLKAIYELVIPFKDVHKNDWFYTMVANAYESELMSGTKVDMFDPDLPTTRGMVATILYRMAKFPSTNYQANFPDVKQNLWYSNAINWASSVKVVNGYQNGTFGPDDNVTREQLAIMIYNYARNVAHYDTSTSCSLEQFADANKVNDYATNAMKWMIEHQIISGKIQGDKTYIDPHANATRAECAKMLYLAYQIFSK